MIKIWKCRDTFNEYSIRICVLNQNKDMGEIAASCNPNYRESNQTLTQCLQNIKLLDYIIWDGWEINIKQSHSNKDLSRFASENR